MDLKSPNPQKKIRGVEVIGKLNWELGLLGFEGSIVLGGFCCPLTVLTLRCERFDVALALADPTCHFGLRLRAPLVWGGVLKINKTSMHNIW